jgi:hypothetical protein
VNRRSFFRRLSAVPLLSLLWRRTTTPMQAAVGPAGSSTRRVRPSDSSWPSPESWEKLKQDVGGQLIPVQPPLAACANGSDAAACQEVIKNLQNPYYIGDQPGATQTTGWVDGWMSAPSAYAVAARSTADVVAAVNFARENNLRLVVKGGGHSYQGTSNAADSLLIWTRAMNGIALHDAFVGQGCVASEARQPAVTVESGQRPMRFDRLDADLEEKCATRHWKVALHFNKGLAGAPAEAVNAARDTATNPAVRPPLLWRSLPAQHHRPIPGYPAMSLTWTRRARTRLISTRPWMNYGRSYRIRVLTCPKAIFSTRTGNKPSGARIILDCERSRRSMTVLVSSLSTTG